MRSELEPTSPDGPARFHEDTIVAIATPPGESAIGIVRLSGPLAFAVVGCVFRQRGAACPNPLLPARTYYGTVHHPLSEQILDQSVVTVYRAPRSYTGEDVAELSAHGNPVVLGCIVDACLACGVRLAEPIRLAEPGEFTLRAFLNGKMDLSQAEAVADLIRARTERSVTAALQQLSGRLGGEIRAIQTELVRLMTHLEASLDFPEDEIEAWSPEAQLETARAALASMVRLGSTYEHGRILREGVTVAIVGKPNVGKSSLLNALLRHDRAIVTPLPGTTRDTLEETLNVGGIPVRAIDTAGIRFDPDEIERLGIERAHRAIADADLVVLVLDASRPLSGEDRCLFEISPESRLVLVRNKCDLPAAWNVDVIPRDMTENAVAVVQTCAIAGGGIHQLEDAISKAALTGSAPDGEPTITRLRHKQALEHASQMLQQAIEALAQGLPADLASIPLRETLGRLGEITGDNLVEAAIHNIFHEFCIGK